MSDNKAQETFKISIEGEGLKVDRSITAEKARELMNIIMGGAATPSAGATRIGTVQEPVARQPARSGMRLSLREFLDDAQAVNWPAKITAIGLYLEEQEQQQDFTREDIRGRFRQAGESQPGNYARDFAVAISNGWVSEENKKPGSYYVTKTGRQAVETKFAGEVKRTSPPARRKTRGAATAGGDDDAAE